MLAILYGAFALGFYVFIVKSAKEVPSPLGVWVGETEESSSVKAA